ncbi:MAG: hypothetical protein HYU63_00575 [Armatimonadetes bacterium]|nr:hypothetical protein [Armatimonadota bacterium]
MRYNQFSSMSNLVSSSINLGGGGGISGQLPPITGGMGIPSINNWGQSQFNYVFK